YNPIAMGTGTYIPDPACSGGMKASNLGMRPENDLRWKNVYSKNGGIYEATVDYLSPDKGKVFLSVNGGDGEIIEYEPSAEGHTASMTVRVKLEPGENEIRLYNDRFRMPEIDRMTIVPTR
ncbi:MAG: alpha-galactosidase, partial [Muribaculaceae bacterium]|nr:alpha-galactosidase [Muribaculaceae bacterium]